MLCSRDTRKRGLVGWTYGAGRVISFSTLMSEMEIGNADYKRLLGNAVRWAANDSVALTTVSAAPATVPGGAPATGTVNLSAPTVADLTVSLSSTIPQIIPPATVVVPKGRTSATFPISTSAVARATSGYVKATYDGVTAQGLLKLRLLGVKSVACAPSVVMGGRQALATVTLEAPAGPGDITVNVASSNAALAQPVDGTGNPITSFVIPAGSLTGTFAVATTPVSADATATLSAAANGYTKTRVLKVRPIGALALSFSPTSVRGGGSTTGTVVLEAAAPAGSGGIDVALADDGSPITDFPAGTTVHVPEGADRATFTVTTVAVSAQTAVRITAKRVVPAGSTSTTRARSLTVKP
jgi:hypothetical protein